MNPLQRRLIAIAPVVAAAVGCSSPSFVIEPEREGGVVEACAPGQRSCKGTCSGGRCVVTLATAQQNPAAVVSDEKDVYWVNQGSPPDYADGSLMMVPVGGGPIKTLASRQQAPGGLAVDATSVYWVTGGPSDGAVLKMPRGGGSITTLASGQAQPAAIAVDATSVYWVNQYAGVYNQSTTCLGPGPKKLPVNLLGTAVGGLVMKIPLEGGTATTLANQQCAPTGLAVDSTSVYWTNEESCGPVAPSTALCPDEPLGTAGNPDPPSPGNTIVSVSSSGGTIATLASSQNMAWPVAVSAASVYFTSPENLAVMKVPLGGGAPAFFATGQYYPWDIVVDEANAYWADLGEVYGDGTIMRAPLDGSEPPLAIAAGQSASYLAVDRKSLYWTNRGASGGDGTVTEISPK